MYICVMNKAGEIQVHRRLRNNDFAYFLRTVAPYRESLAICCEATFNWYWLADRCQEESLEFVLSHPYYLRLIHGAKTKNDRLDSQRLTELFRAGLIPQAFVYPAAMRTTRDLLRRRTGFVRDRAELLEHLQVMNYQYNLPALGTLAKCKATRDQVPDHFPEPNVRAAAEADVDMMDACDHVIARLEKRILTNAREHDPRALAILKTTRGVGDIVGLTLLYELHDIERFGTVGRYLSYCRLVKAEHSSDGKKVGSGNKNIGNAYLRWGYGEASHQFLTHHPRGDQLLDRLVKKHGNERKARSVLAAKLARSHYFMLTDGTAFNEEEFLKHLP
jgi:transposase